MAKKRGRKKGVKLSPETVAKIQASNKATRESLGIRPNRRHEESDAPQESNDTYGSTGRRIHPRFGSGDKF